jgi:hypothetical protein
MEEENGEKWEKVEEIFLETMRERWRYYCDGVSWWTCNSMCREK